MKKLLIFALVASLTLCFAPIAYADSTSTTTSTSGSSSSSASASATGDKTSTSTSSTSSSSNTTTTTTTTETRRSYYDDGGYWRNGSYYDSGYRYTENGIDYYDDGYIDRNGNWHYYSDGGGYWRNGRWYPNESKNSGGYIDGNGNWHSYGSNNNRSTTTTNNYQYYIVVDRNANTLTVWGKDRWGEYTNNQLTVKCSTGRNGKTPTGTYTINNKYANGGFQALSDGTYTKSCMGLSNGILIHSVCYPSTNSSPYKEDISAIGAAYTNGNIMLTEKDAASLFSMIVPGTSITIY